MGQLTRFMQEKGISQHLAVRVQRATLNALQLQNQNTPEKSVLLLSLLSQNLRKELHREMYTPILTLHPFFRSLLHELDDWLSEICHNTIFPLQLALDDVL